MTDFTPIVNQPFVYIAGCQLSLLSATSFIITSGQCRDSTDNYDLNVSSTITLSTSTNGINGIDTGAVSTNKWYYVFVIGDRSLNNSPVGLFSLSSTAPVLPAGYNIFRLIGVIRTDGSSLILSVSHQGNGNLRRYFYKIEKAAAVLLAAGASTTYAAVNCSSLIPPNAQIGKLLFEYTPNTADDKFFVRTTGSGLTELLAIPGPTNAKKCGGQIEVITDSAQSIDYHVTTTGSLSLWIQSFDLFV